MKRAIVKSMAETTAWRSHCQFITFITFLFTVSVMRQMAKDALYDGKHSLF